MQNKNKLTNIVPVVESSDVTITKFKIAKVIVNIYNNAKIKVKLFNGTKLIRTEDVEMSPSDYAQWGSDDSFIKTFVSQKLGYTASD